MASVTVTGWLSPHTMLEHLQHQPGHRKPILLLRRNGVWALDSSPVFIYFPCCRKRGREVGREGGREIRKEGETEREID